MQIGMIGLGRMGANMVRRLLAGGHQCVVFDRNPAAAQELVALGAVAASSLAGLVEKLTLPRTVWIMLPAAAVDETVTALAALLTAGDCIVDGGNSRYEAPFAGPGAALAGIDFSTSASAAASGGWTAATA